MGRQQQDAELEGQKRILIVDAHPLVRAGLAAALGGQPRFQVCGEVANHREALSKIDELKPELVTLGFGGNSHLLELLKDIRVRFPKLLILAISGQYEFLFARRVLKAGANGCITMFEPLTEVLEAIECIFAGETYVSSCILSQITRQMAGGWRMDNDRSLHNLTDRELEIFELTGRGLCAREIAGQLNLGKSTVETYRNRIKEKLCLQDSSDLLRSAISWKCSGSLNGQSGELTFKVNLA